MPASVSLGVAAILSSFLMLAGTRLLRRRVQF
jgi:hypothetical protein